MSDYLDFASSGISIPSGNAFQDGKYLAAGCRKKLTSRTDKDFSPKLLILLASESYLDPDNAKQLLDGVNETFRENGKQIPLIGSTVAGVFFGSKIHTKGALLICLSSRLIDAKVAEGENARLDPKTAVNQVLEKLGLEFNPKFDPNPLANRIIITFLPGCKYGETGDAFYPAPILHGLLYEGVQARIMLAGGISSANDSTRRKVGLQFSGGRVLCDSMVAASVKTGIPIGIGLNDALLRTGKLFYATSIDDGDSRIVHHFNGEINITARDSLMKRNGGRFTPPLLAKFSAEDEKTSDTPLFGEDGSVRLLRPCNKNNIFEILQPQSVIIEKLKSGIKNAQRRVFIEHPAANILFACRVYRQHNDNFFEFEKALTEIKRSGEAKRKKDIPCIGGFFDGEIGVDDTGRSRLMNGGIGFLTFGDEMRERTPIYEGVYAIEKLGPEMLQIPQLKDNSNYEAIISKTVLQALKIIQKAGFPGAMISVLKPTLDNEGKVGSAYMVPQAAIGERFQKIKNEVNATWDKNDILMRIVKGSEPYFIPDSRNSLDPISDVVKRSGIISQYILPLEFGEKTFGILQVNVGDYHTLSPKQFRDTEKARVLNCLAEIIGAGLGDIGIAIENHVMQRLDDALKASLLAKSIHEGLETFNAAAGLVFGAQVDRLWLVDRDETEDGQPPRKLLLETSRGAGYKSLVNLEDPLPICRAFKADGPQILNETRNDPLWEAMREKGKGDSEFPASLNKIRSYAAVAIRSEDNKKLGAISFSSDQPWFFFYFHKNILKVLAARLGFLLQHLEAKILREFLYEVTPKMSELNLDSDKWMFKKVVNSFRSALNAEHASLYLWEKEREKYILRAESKWKDKRWLNAAQYGPNDQWIGVTAIKGKPFYTADLLQYYKDKGLNPGEPSTNGSVKYGGRYAKQIFGRHLSADFKVEAIGLPLQLGPDNDEDKFGVLTLYRHIPEGQSSTGFYTKDKRLLMQGAYNAAGLVNAVRQHLYDVWDREQQDRTQKVHRAITSNKNVTFEMKICQAILTSYRADEVVFYRSDDSDKPLKSMRMAAHKSSSKRFPLLAGRRPYGGNLSLIKNTIRRLPNGSETYDVAFRLFNAKKGKPVSAADFKIHQLVNEACIPLIGDRKCRGAIIIRWKLVPADISLRYTLPFNRGYMSKLGRIIGSAYFRDEVAKTREQTDLALRATAAFAVQRAHLLRNIVQDISNISTSLRKNPKVGELIKLINIAMDIVSETTVLGSSVLNPSRGAWSLASLIRHTLAEQGSILLNSIEREQIVFSNTVPEDIMVWVDREHTIDALYNLIHNAVKFVIQKKRSCSEDYEPKIEIETTTRRDGKIVLVISDNGVGMTNEEKENALRGFVVKNGREGVGVLIAYVLLASQGGSLRFNSKKSLHTNTIVTFLSSENGANK